MSIISSTAEKLRDPEYRKAFVASQINVGIPFQIRALLKARGMTQDWLAKKTGMLQPRISGLMTPGKTHPNIETLRRVAEAFDCGLAVRFVPFAELAEWSDAFDPDTFNVPDFSTEMAESEQAAASAAPLTSQPPLRREGLTLDALQDWARLCCQTPEIIGVLTGEAVTAPANVTTVVYSIDKHPTYQGHQVEHETIQQDRALDRRLPPVMDMGYRPQASQSLG